MASSGDSPKHHFDIHASVVLQLGESLITDVAQALVELVKNAYDADANSAKVIVNTENTLEDSYYKDAIGYITIEDDGIGMDEETIARGWLTVSNSPKREMKRMGLATKRGRTPLGDKGLGRLSAQRLAVNVEIFTRPSGSPVEYHVAFSWDSFSQENLSLTQVPIIFEELEPRRVQGTKLVLSGLRDIDSWKEDNAISELQNNLSQLISPYRDIDSWKEDNAISELQNNLSQPISYKGEVRDFIVVAIINGGTLNLAKYSAEFKKAAIVNYKFEFDETEFKVKGKARLEFFRPANTGTLEEKQNYRLYIESDEGKNFLEFLLSKKQAEDYHLKSSLEDGWYVEYELTRSFPVDKVKPPRGKPANPGRFHGEIDGFKFDTDFTLKSFVKDLGGIRVFRDGFGVRTDSDILQLRKQQTSGGSFYGLRPQNVAGYIAISAKYNAVLEETTSRQDFQTNPYYDNFYLLLQVLSKFTANTQEFLGRSRVQFYREKEKNLKIPKPETVEEISREISKGLSPAINHEESLKKTRENLDSATEEAQQIVKIASDFYPADTLQNQPVYTVTQSFTKRVEQVKKEVTQVENYLHDIPSLQEKIDLLSNQLTILKGQIAVLAEQLSQTYETMSLGLTAEALSHEIATIAEQLGQRNRQVTEHLTKINSKDLTLAAFTRYISASVSSLRKQLSHLEPSLRYIRENREEILLTEYFKEVEEYYRNRFETHNMEMRVKLVEGSGQFGILMNRGKLNQVIDNLLLNSEYWLREDLRLKLLARGIITVEISKPFVRISDNSRGIEPSVENSLFEPFVTTKGQGRGRGLGLFIVRQLLEADNCAISLLPERNKHNRLYIFEISFTGALNASK